VHLGELSGDTWDEDTDKIASFLASYDMIFDHKPAIYDTQNETAFSNGGLQEDLLLGEFLPRNASIKAVYLPPFPECDFNHCILIFETVKKNLNY